MNFYFVYKNFVSYNHDYIIPTKLINKIRTNLFYQYSSLFDFIISKTVKLLPNCIYIGNDTLYYTTYSTYL